MGFTSTVYLINFDKNRYIKALNEEMTDNVKEAAKSWLRTVLVLIPVWSRASRATFSKLADAVGFNLVFPSKRSYKDRKSLGAQTSRGGLKIVKDKTWHFFYETDLRYLAWNEFNRAVKGDGSGVFSKLRRPGPYRFQDAGAADFRSFAAQVRLPNPIKFITPQKI